MLERRVLPYRVEAIIGPFLSPPIIVGHIAGLVGLIDRGEQCLQEEKWRLP
mgnify:CR=1 FL=1